MVAWKETQGFQLACPDARPQAALPTLDKRPVQACPISHAPRGPAKLPARPGPEGGRPSGGASPQHTGRRKQAHGRSGSPQPRHLWVFLRPRPCTYLAPSAPRPTAPCSTAPSPPTTFTTKKEKAWPGVPAGRHLGLPAVALQRPRAKAAVPQGLLLLEAPPGPDRGGCRAHAPTGSTSSVRGAFVPAQDQPCGSCGSRDSRHRLAHRLLALGTFLSRSCVPGSPSTLPWALRSPGHLPYQGHTCQTPQYSPG